MDSIDKGQFVFDTENDGFAKPVGKKQGNDDEIENTTTREHDKMDLKNTKRDSKYIYKAKNKPRKRTSGFMIARINRKVNAILKKQDTMMRILNNEIMFLTPETSDESLNETEDTICNGLTTKENVANVIVDDDDDEEAVDCECSDVDDESCVIFFNPHAI